ncbi:uncharacterized protein LOC110182560 isoform X2 [Drosophila serrata]|uniref:uncharacterized protein LOC110182560 isoform X2 n=1 Tax=Drosophila serrata TaxID=7274 RepID=UPI000A1D11AC|nr:uncharacterized protein LOC110182560 isoform X2 [Drosophila serrata]
MFNQYSTTISTVNTSWNPKIPGSSRPSANQGLCCRVDPGQAWDKCLPRVPDHNVACRPPFFITVRIMDAGIKSTRRTTPPE